MLREKERAVYAARKDLEDILPKLELVRRATIDVRPLLEPMILGEAAPLTNLSVRRQGRAVLFEGRPALDLATLRALLPVGFRVAEYRSARQVVLHVERARATP